MEFLYPHVLYGLFAVAIPIIVHLFNFRRYQKLYFSNVAVLKNIQKKTRKQSQLKHLIVLLLRILAIVAIVMAFSGPIIPNAQESSNNQGQNQISIYIDNSYSMTHLGENGSLLNEAKNMALGILDSYNNADQFHLITNDMQAKHHRWFNKMEMAQNILEVDAVHMQQNLRKIIEREKILRDQEESSFNPVLYILSDFQKNSSFNEAIQLDSLLKVRLIPLQNNPVNNLSIDSLWFKDPVQLPSNISTIKVKLSNNGEDDQNNIPLKLLVNEIQKTLISVDLKAGESNIFEISFTNTESGLFKGRVEIEDYPIIYDDQLYFTFKVRELFKVALIYETMPNPYLQQLYSGDSIILLTTWTKSRVDYNLLGQQDLVVLDELTLMSSGLQNELTNYVKNGGQLLMIPSESFTYNDWLQQNRLPAYIKMKKANTFLSEIDQNLEFFQPVFEDKLPIKNKNQKVDLPAVKSYFTIDKKALPSSITLLKSRTEEPLLIQTPLEKGMVFQLAFPLQRSYSQLPEHPLFVPVFYQMLLQSNISRKLYEILGSGDAVDISMESITVNRPTDNPVYLRNETESWIPEIRYLSPSEWIILNVEWPSDGYYEADYEDQKIDQFAVNYSRKESDFSIWSQEELAQKIAAENWPNFQILSSVPENISAQIIQMDQGVRLWKWFLFFAIIFIFVETLLLRLWK